MKQNNKECKIVQDLLPNYIENLTAEETNQYIEEHIAGCKECEEALKNMNGEIKLEQINQDKEIKYLKAIRRRVKTTIAVVSLLVIIVASCIVGYVYNKSKIQVNNYTFLMASYIKENQEGTIDGNIYGKMIAVFDENDICKSVRVVQTGYLKEKIYEEYQAIKIMLEKSSTNTKIENEKLYYNVNIWNGLRSAEIKNYWVSNYNIQEIYSI